MTRPTITELYAHPFLFEFPEHKIELIADLSQRVTLAESEQIFEEGGEADRLWLLWRGQVDLNIHLPGKGILAVETLGYGDVLGWSWLYPPHEWKFGAVAAVETEAIEIDAAAMRALCESDVIFGREIYKRFAKVAIAGMQAIRSRLFDLYEVSH